MSAYIVSNNTINVLADAIENYGVRMNTDYKGIAGCGVIFDVNEIKNAIGQKLLDQNYKSVNYRYDEDTPAPEYKYQDVAYTTGDLYGCIRCYEYQACETPDYFESDVHMALANLKDRMLKRYIMQDGCEIGWGME